MRKSVGEAENEMEGNCGDLSGSDVGGGGRGRGGKKRKEKQKKRGKEEKGKKTKMEKRLGREKKREGGVKMKQQKMRNASSCFGGVGSADGGGWICRWC